MMNSESWFLNILNIVCGNPTAAVIVLWAIVLAIIVVVIVLVIAVVWQGREFNILKIRIGPKLESKPQEYIVRLLTTETEWYSQAQITMEDARDYIDDASLSPRGFSRNSPESLAYYKCRNRMIAAGKRYRYVAVFTGPTEENRYNMVKDWIKNYDDKNIFVHYYRHIPDPEVPMLNLLIADNKEVLIGLFYHEEAKRTLFIQNHNAINLFCNYFD